MNPQVLMAQALERHRQGDISGAEQYYRQVLRMVPGDRDAQHMLAVAVAQQGRREEAREMFEQVLSADPRDPLALTNYANVLRELGRHGAALEMLDRALALDPRDAERWNSRGMVLQSLTRFDEALRSVEQALALRPGHPGAMRGHADLLQSLGHYRHALEAYDRLLERAPNDAGLWNNRGISLRNLGMLEASSQSFERAAALDPRMMAARFHIGLNHLLAGDVARGLPLYELRKEMPEPVEARVYRQPLWTGKEDLTGKHLFVYIEQGLGDTIQFCRFIRPLQERGAAVTLSVYGPMMRLLKEADLDCALIGWGEVPGQFDYHIPLMSLPLALGTNLDNIPAPRRYLEAEPERVAHWAKRIGPEGFRIGVAWRGNQSVFGAEGKEFPLTALAAFSRIPGVRLISLQKDPGAVPRGRRWSGSAISIRAPMPSSTALRSSKIWTWSSAPTARLRIWPARWAPPSGSRSSMCRTGAGSLGALTAPGTRPCACSARQNREIGTAFLARCGRFWTRRYVSCVLTKI